MYGYSYSFASLLCTNILSHILYVCVLQFLFSSWLFLSIRVFLPCLIDSHTDMNWAFNMMSCPSTIWILTLNVTYVVRKNQFLLLYFPRDLLCLGTYFVCQACVRGLL